MTDKEIMQELDEIWVFGEEPTSRQRAAANQAIDLIEEVQQYKALGTVEEFKNCKDILSKAEADELSKVIDEWLLYQKIGKVEETQEAMEKQIAKKPTYEGDGYSDGEIVYDTWICPCCDKEYEVDYDDYDYCPNCGQHIDWSEI